MKRIAYIDLMKVYAIFLVILGHSPIWTGFVNQLEHSFAMPVFFALYGMTYNIERHAAKGFFTTDFVKQRFIRLMIPAIIWAIIYSMISPFDDNPFHLSNLLHIAYFSQASLRYAGSLSSIWFIPCMFLAVLLTELIIGFIHKRSKGPKPTYKLIILAIIVLASITFVLPRFSRGYPWCTNLVPLATAMILIGYLVRQIVNVSSNWCTIHKLSIPLALVLAFALLCLASWYNWLCTTGKNVDMASAKFGNPMLYLLGAIAGIVMVVTVSIITCPPRLHPAIAFAGANTYGIFLVHKPLIIALGTLLASVGYGNLFTAFLSAIIVLIISATLTFIIDKICPPLIGNKKN